MNCELCGEFPAGTASTRPRCLSWGRDCRVRIAARNPAFDDALWQDWGAGGTWGGGNVQRVTLLGDLMTLPAFSQQPMGGLS